MTDDEINSIISNLYGWSADYCHDLNAMHEVEVTLGKRLSDYGEWLCEMTLVSKEDFPSCYIWHATARQRAEAFLRVMGKWETVVKECFTTEADLLGDANKMVEEVQP